MSVPASQLFYWIPEKSNFPNPSRHLRRIAVRLDGSVWTIPTHLVPHSLCHAMTEAGVTWYVLKFDTAEAENMAKIAHAHLRKEIEAGVKRAEKALRDAERAYETTEEGKEPVTITAFEERTNKAVKRAKELLGDLEEAARVFEIDPATLPITWAAAQADLIGQAARARAKAYAEAGTTAATLPGGGFIANAVAADAIPANVVADFLTENGHEEQGEQLAAVFAPDERLDDWGDEEKLSWE